MIDLTIQAVILVLGVLYMWLYSCSDIRSVRRGHWVMAAAQPAWMWSNAEAGQWGMFALAIIYLGFALRGLARTREVVA